MGLNLSKNHTDQNIAETIDFFQNSAWSVAIGIAFGISVSLAYLFFSQTKYEASASIDVSAINAVLTKQEANQLALEIKNLSSYGGEVLAACTPNSSLSSFKSNTKIYTEPSSPDQIRFELISTNQEEGVRCLKEIIKSAKEFQLKAISNVMEDRKRGLIKLEKETSQTKSLLTENADSQIKVFANYLILRDELNNLAIKKGQISNQIDEMNRITEHLKSQIAISTKIISLQKKIILLNGLFSGVILGLLMHLLFTSKFFTFKNQV